MTNEAQQARENAISLEVKKDGLRQRQSGDWVLSLVIAAVHMDPRIASAAMGQMYECALAELDDDRTAKPDPLKTAWRELSPVKQAALRCRDPVFWAFLEEENICSNARSEEEAADAVRAICGVASRSDIARSNNAKLAWYGLDQHFQAWKAAQ